MGLYFRHSSSLLHDTGSHPERADRIRALEAAMEDVDWLRTELHEAAPASRGQLELVHDAAHIERIERFCADGGGLLDMDTVAVEASWDAALRAAGGAVEAAQRLLAGEDDFAFSAMRPPGHHAESSRPMGFCLFNSIAVAAASAIEAGAAERVLILDWDVHHGNGTEEIFARRGDVLYCSIHQSPLYPGTGQPRDVGTGDGHGFNINLPVGPGADGELFLGLIEHVLAPIAREFRPGLIGISAGYDAHRDDPLADCDLTDGDYGLMAAAMRDLGTELGAPVLVCLEGGYDLGALSRSAVETIRALGGSSPAPGVDAERVAPARRAFSEIWPVLA